VVAPEQFLMSHLIEGKLGIGAALENLRLYRKALERAGIRRGGKHDRCDLEEV